METVLVQRRVGAGQVATPVGSPPSAVAYLGVGLAVGLVAGGLASALLKLPLFGMATAVGGAIGAGGGYLALQPKLDAYKAQATAVPGTTSAPQNIANANSPPISDAVAVTNGGTYTAHISPNGGKLQIILPSDWDGSTPIVNVTAPDMSISQASYTIQQGSYSGGGTVHPGLNTMTVQWNTAATTGDPGVASHGNLASIALTVA